jgi:hypothetical protein
VKGNLLFKWQKTVSAAKPKYVAYPYEWGTRFKYLTAGSQSAYSRNRLATIEPIAGISHPMHVKNISSVVPISAINQ